MLHSGNILALGEHAPGGNLDWAAGGTWEELEGGRIFLSEIESAL